MKHQFNISYLDNERVIFCIYSFIKQRIDYYMSYHYIQNNMQDNHNINNKIGQLINIDLSNYLILLINQYSPYYININGSNKAMLLDLLLNKWNPITKIELELRIEHMQTHVMSQQRTME